MQVRVLKRFADKVTFKMYEVGEKINLPDARALSVIERGLAEDMTAGATEEPKSEPKKKATKKKG